MIHDTSSLVDGSMMVRSAKSDTKWNSKDFPDIFDQPKLKLERLFDNGSSRLSPSENQCQNNRESSGKVLQDDLFVESYGTLTKNRLSNIMGTIPDTYSKDSAAFTWPHTKSSSDRPTISKANDSYPDDIDFVEGSVSENTGIVEKSNLDLKPHSESLFSEGMQFVEEKALAAQNFANEGRNYLDLSRQSLDSLHDVQKKLKGLKIDHNRISGISHAPESLRFLQASSNQLSNTTTFAHLKTVTFLDISFNKLSSLSALSPLNHLMQLIVDDNEITDFSPVFRLRNLVTLKASKNLAQTIDFKFSYLPRLQVLDFSGNKINSIRSLHKLCALASLSLDDNLISMLEVESRLNHLSYLSLNDNMISSLNISLIPNLQRLLVDRNPVEKLIGYEKCGMLIQLSADSLSSNKLTLDKNVHNFQLQDFRFGGNPSFQFHPSIMVNLRSLDLSECVLIDLPNCLTYAKNLTYLSVEGNQLHTISRLVYNDQLRILNLCHNRIQDLIELTKVIRMLPNLQILDVQGNPLIPQNVSNSQKEVLRIVLRVSLLVCNENIVILNQESVTSKERRNAKRRMDILRKHAVDQLGQETPVPIFENWKPILHPIQDMTVADEIVLELVK